MFSKALGFLVMLSLCSAQAVEFQSRLINGKPVEPGTYKEVVKITSQGASCTATIVGPRAIMTAAHCAQTGAMAEFTVGGKSYSAKMTRSSLYPAQDHDISVGVTDTDILGVEPASVGGTAKPGLGITLLGYGCTQVGGGGTNDGVLRYGETAIVEFNGFEMVSRMPNGAALCYGDSGGPAFVFSKGQHLLLGVNSKGNIQDTNYDARTDIPESMTFIKNYADSNHVEICGVNKNCGGVVPVAPTCKLAAAPSPITLGQSLTLSLTGQGQISSATLLNQAVNLVNGQASQNITPASVGDFTVSGSVTGPGGTGNCSASYTVKPKPNIDPPNCSLSVSPTSIKIGESVTATLSTLGQVTSASIDGQSVSVGGGSIKITPIISGNRTATGTVTGPGGSTQCSASYYVEGPTPNVPNFTVVPTYCGDNTIIETQIKEVCMGLVKFSYGRDISVKDLLVVTYRDGSKELMPLLLKRDSGRDSQDRATQELTLYANGSKLKDSNLMLDTRAATLVLGTSGSLAGVPIAISGRAVKNGQAFNVDQLKKLGP